jgi:peroxiredoxin family protein
MDILIWSKSGSLSSMMTCVVLAMNAKGGGVDVGVMFSEEALAALMDKKFYPSPPGVEAHLADVAANAAKMGLTIPADPTQLVAAAAGAGVKLFACPAWGPLLGVAGRIPPEVKLWDIPTGLRELGGARQVVGGP